MDKNDESTSMSTEHKILDAAKRIFILHGLDGTSMQQIADEAQINKSLLHYYYRSKEKLFDAVFSYAFRYIVPELQGIMNSDDSIFVKIERIVQSYIELLMKNKFIPAFVLHEINRDPQRLYNIMQKSGVSPEIFVNQFIEEMKKGTIRTMDPRQLIVNIISMCILPVAARPLLQRIIFDNKEDDYLQFMEERKKAVSEFIINAIKI